MSDLRARGLQIAAAEADAPLTAAQADLRGPLAIVVGSEGQGLSPAIRRRSDVAVRIPMRGAIGSLNAAVAGSILLFAAVAQRDPTGLGDKPARPAAADAWPIRKGQERDSTGTVAADEAMAADEAPAADDALAAEQASHAETKPPRGQSVGLAIPTEAPAEAPLDKPKPGRRRTATTTTAPESAKAGALETVRPARRASRKPAAAEATPAEASTEPSTTGAKPTQRGKKRASPPGAAAKPLPGTTKHLRPRAARRAAAAAAPATPAAPSKPARRRANTKTPAAPPEPASDPHQNDDELLPGGPDPT
jgi:hypothetical protein